MLSTKIYTCLGFVKWRGVTGPGESLHVLLELMHVKVAFIFHSYIIHVRYMYVCKLQENVTSYISIYVWIIACALFNVPNYLFIARLLIIFIRYHIKTYWTHFDRADNILNEDEGKSGDEDEEEYFMWWLAIEGYLT